MKNFFSSTISVALNATPVAGVSSNVENYTAWVEGGEARMDFCMQWMRQRLITEYTEYKED